MRNVQIRIKRLPEGEPTPGDFELVELDRPGIKGGEVLVQAKWLSLDPYVRSLMSGRHFLGTPQPGSVVPARAVAEVIESRHDVYSVGDCLVLEMGLQRYLATNAVEAHKLRPGQTPASTALGVLGMPGMTAYFGLLEVGRLKPRETVLVSAASGAVGSMVGQIAQLKGARAIGIAGSKEKCDWVVRHARFAACINYKTENLSERLRGLAPNGVDIYFDNLGGAVLESVIAGRHLAMNARVVLCGLVTQYNLREPPPGPNLGPLMASRAQILPMIVYDYQHRREEFLKEAIPWFESGLIVHKEDIVEGLANAAGHFCRLMRGENFGKALVRV
jgi:hypothetical protein